MLWVFMFICGTYPTVSVGENSDSLSGVDGTPVFPAPQIRMWKPYPFPGGRTRPSPWEGIRVR